MIKDKRILITGGGGFIGTALARRLAPYNDVTRLDLSFHNEVDNTRDVYRNILDSLDHWVEAKHIVIHTAARVGVAEVLEDTIATLRVNYTGTANLLQSALDSSCCEQVICFSTSEVFGTGADKVAENGTPMFPDAMDKRWCYGVGKLAAEHLAFGYYHQHELPVTVIRPFNVFGEGRTGNYALLHFISNALRGDDLMVYGDGSQVRAWCHIDDFCDAILGTLDTREAIGKAFNIGNPDNAVTVRRLAAMVIRLCQSESKVVFKPLPFTDIDVRIPDIMLARSVLGFSPKIQLEDGLRRTIDWAKDREKESK